MIAHWLGNRIPSMRRWCGLSASIAILKAPIETCLQVFVNPFFFPFSLMDFLPLSNS